MGGKVNNQQGHGEGIGIKMNGRYNTPGNLGFADWTQLFGDPILTAALLDRLTHRAHIIMCNWESFRLKESLKKGSPVKRSNK